MPTSGSYTFTPTQTVTHSVTCENSVGTKDSESTTIQVIDPPNLQVMLHTPADQGSYFGLNMHFQSGTWDSLVPVEANGLVKVAMSSAVRGRLAGDIKFTIDVMQGGTRAFLPSIGTLSQQMALAGQTVSGVLIPAKWSINCGTFSGHTEEISLEKAYAPAGDGLEFYYEDWFWQHFPRFWAFDRVESNVQFNEADSLAVEATWSRLESALCEDLAKPGSYDQVISEGGWRIKVQTDLPFPGQGGGARKDVSAPYLFWGITRVKEKSFLGSRVQEHELGHTFGFGHTCSWITIMNTGCTSEVSTGISASDVAYIKLFYAVRKLEVAHNATFGMAEAREGERQLILGLPPGIREGLAEAQSPPNQWTWIQ